MEWKDKEVEKEEEERGDEAYLTPGGRHRFLASLMSSYVGQMSAPWPLETARVLT